MKKIIILMTTLLLLTGCTTHILLNENEKNRNDNNIRYIKSVYPSSDISFISKKSIENRCLFNITIDGGGPGFLCNYLPDVYIWNYEICPLYAKDYCIKATYNDYTKEWNIPDKGDYKFVNGMLKTIAENNIKYTIFYGSRYSSSKIYILIRKNSNSDQLVNVLLDIKSSYTYTNFISAEYEVLIFNENEYDYIVNNAKRKEIDSNAELYKSINENYVIGYKRIVGINNEMFNCENNNYKYTAWELVFHNNMSSQCIVYN